MQECFNTRQFDQADDLVTPGFFSHPLGTTGIEAGKDAWRKVVAQFPGMRVVAEDILVDGDKVAVRSSVEGIAPPDGGSQPMLIEIFRIDDGRLAETWGITEGPDPRLS
jgi:predicted SnoaL-like aldol condensation-catalyzing enzyme